MNEGKEYFTNANRTIKNTREVIENCRHDFVQVQYKHLNKLYAAGYAVAMVLILVGIPFVMSLFFRAN